MKKFLLIFASLFLSASAISAADIEPVGGTFKPAQGGFYNQASSRYSFSVNGTEIPVLDGYNRQGEYLGYDLVRFTAPAGTTTKARVTVPGTIATIQVHPVMLGIEPVKIDDKTYEFEVPDPSKTPYYLYVDINSNHIVVCRDVPEVTPSGSKVYNVATYLSNAGVDATVEANAKKVAEAFQSAIDDATVAGTEASPATVYVPAGLYYMANITLKSNIDFHLSRGAVIRATSNKADYNVNYNKTSLGRDGTWWISTVNDPENPTRNLRISGYGTIDANGYYWQKIVPNNSDRFCITALHILHAENVTVDGVTILETPMWGTMLGRSNDVKFSNVKFLNSTDGNENDGIDVMESQRVVIDRAIGIALDDPFSTKTWMGQELFKNWTGVPEALDDVTFNHCVSWTYCGAYKMGHGGQQKQTNVKVINSVVLNSGRAIGIEPKYVNTEPIAGFHDVLFENIDIEHASGEGWLKLLSETPGAGYPPIKNVTLRNINIRQKGSASSLRGANDEFFVDGVTFDNITMYGNTEPVKTLAELNITNTGFYKNVSFVQDASHEVDHRIEAEYNNYLQSGTLTYNTGTGADTENPGGAYIKEISTGKHLLFRNVDFGSSCGKIAMRVLSQRSVFTFTARIDAADGPVVATGDIARGNNWVTIEADLSAEATGSHDLYVTFDKKSGPSDLLTGFNFMEIKGRAVNDLTALKGEDVKLNIMMSTALKPVYEPADAYQRDVEWKLAEATPEGCVTLSRDGVVSGIAVGKARIEACSTWDNSIVATFNVDVVDELSFSKLRIEVEDADAIYNDYHYDAAMSVGEVKDPEEEGSRGLNSCWNSNFVVFNKVDFGEGAVKATIRKGYPRGSALEIWIDPVVDTENHTMSGGTKIVDVEFPAVGTDWTRWITMEAPILADCVGEHSMAIYFKAGGGSAENQNYGAINWVEFTVLDSSAEVTSITADDVEVHEGVWKSISAIAQPEHARKTDFSYSLVSAEPEDCVTLNGNQLRGNAVGKAVVRITAVEFPSVYTDINVTVINGGEFNTTRIEMENYDEIYNDYHYDAAMSAGAVKDPEEEGAQGLNSCWNTNMVVFHDIDFADGASKVTIRKGYPRGSALEIWIDPVVDPSSHALIGGTKIAEAEFKASTTDWNRWGTFEVPVTGECAGIHNMAVYFKAGGGSATNQNYGSINWIELTLLESPKAVTSIEAEDIEVHEGIWKAIKAITQPDESYADALSYSLVSAEPEDCVTLNGNQLRGNAAGKAVVRISSVDFPAVYSDINVTVVNGGEFSTTRIEMENYDEMYNDYHYGNDASMSAGAVKDPEEEGAQGLNSCWNSNFVVFHDINFANGASKVTIRKGYPRGSALEIWIDPVVDPNSRTIVGGTKIVDAEFPAASTDWNRWTTMEFPVNADCAGVHNMAVYFKAGGGSADNQNYGSINWIELTLLDNRPYIRAIEADDVEVNVGVCAAIEAVAVPENARDAELSYTLISTAPEGCVTLSGNQLRGIEPGEAVVRVSAVSNPEIYTDINVYVVEGGMFNTTRIEMEDYDEMYNDYHYGNDASMSAGAVKDPEEEGAQGLNSCWNSNFVVFHDIDFEDGGSKVTVRKGYPRGSALEVWIDPVVDPSSHALVGGTRIAEMEFPAASTDWNRWITKEAPVVAACTGVHDIAVYFKAGGGSATNQNYGAINWMELTTLKKSTTAVSNVAVEDEITVSARVGQIIISATKDATIGIYTIDGRCVRIVNVVAGDTVVDGLTRGLYIVNRTLLELTN